MAIIRNADTGHILCEIEKLNLINSFSYGKIYQEIQ